MRKKLLTMCIIIVLALSSLYSASLMLEPMFDDPLASEQFLSFYDFNTPIDEAMEHYLENVSLSVVTLGPDDPPYVWFGHSSLVVHDKNIDQSIMYDYGIFSFDEGYYTNFLLGRLEYEIWATSYDARIAMAISENRDVRELELQLSRATKYEIMTLLHDNVQPEYNTYLYHPYIENCATRLRDILDKAVGGQLYRWAHSIELDESFRSLANRHTAHSPILEWSLNFLQGRAIDHPITLWEAMYLPTFLEEALTQFSYIDEHGALTSLVDKEIVHHSEVGHPRFTVLQHSPTLYWRTLLFSLALSFVLIVLARFQSKELFYTKEKIMRFGYGIMNTLIYTLLGAVSTILAVMMITTNHDVTYFNENIIFISPLLLVAALWALLAAGGNPLALYYFRKANTLFAVITALYIVMKLALSFVMIQDSWEFVFSVLPLYIANSTIPFEKIILRKKHILDNANW